MWWSKKKNHNTDGNRTRSRHTGDSGVSVRCVSDGVSSSAADEDNNINSYNGVMMKTIREGEIRGKYISYDDRGSEEEQGAVKVAKKGQCLSQRCLLCLW